MLMWDCVPSFLERLQLKRKFSFWQLQRMLFANTLSSKLAQFLTSTEPTVWMAGSCVNSCVVWGRFIKASQRKVEGPRFHATSRNSRRWYGIAVAFPLGFEFFLFSFLILNAWRDFWSFADVHEHLSVIWAHIKAFKIWFPRGGET